MNNLEYLLKYSSLKQQTPELQKICKNIFHKSKAIRSKLVSLVGSYLSLTQKEIVFLSCIIECIHNSSLLHDDFIDHSKTRRNYKTAWLEFSPSQAILAGDYLLANVSLQLANYKNLDLLKHTAQALCELTQGEFLQRESFNFKDKDLSKRDRINELKTAALFKWCLQAPFFVKNETNKKLQVLLNRIGFSFGILFQRSDDLLDFNIRNLNKKTVLSDMKQKYYNSFACFLLQNATRETETRFKQVVNISQVHDCFPNFKKQVQSFDSLNENLIQQCHKDIDKLKIFLTAKQRGLIDALQKRSSFLYWRQ